MNIKIHSKLSEEEFKDFLMFRQFKMNKSFVPVRVALSAAIGLLAAFIGTGNKVVSFAVIFAICLAVFIWFPKMNISSKYKKIYRRNLSGAFHQYQDFCFTDNAVGFKSESEEEYDWTMYDNLQYIGETDKIFVVVYNKKQQAVASKSGASEDDIRALSELVSKRFGKKQ